MAGLKFIGEYMGVEVYHDSTMTWATDQVFAGRRGRQVIEEGIVNVDINKWNPVTYAKIDENRSLDYKEVTPPHELLHWVLGGAEDVRYYMPYIRKLLKDN